MNDLGRNENGGFVPRIGDADSFVQRLLGDVAGRSEAGGQPVVSEAQRLKEERHRAQEDLLRNYVKVFSTPAGEKVLEHLLDVTLRRSFKNTENFESIEKVALYTAERTGQNAIVTMILSMIVSGRDLPAPQAKKRKK